MLKHKLAQSETWTIHRGSWKDNQILAQPVLVYTDLFFTNIYIRPAPFSLYEVRHSFFLCNMNLKEANGSGSLDTVNSSHLFVFHWFLFMICTFIRQRTSTPLKWGLFGKLSKKYIIFAFTRDTTQASNFSNFIQYLIPPVCYKLMWTPVRSYLKS